MSQSWIPVATANDIQPGSYQVITVNCLSIILIHHQSHYFALENVCSHDGGELEGGELDHQQIVCPRHGAGFCIKTGSVTRGPAYEGISTFETRVREGTVEIRI